MTDAERIEKLEAKSGQAYLTIGWLLYQCGLFGTDEGQRALDYFSNEGHYDDDFLPWPATKDLSAKP